MQIELTFLFLLVAPVLNCLNWWSGLRALLIWTDAFILSAQARHLPLPGCTGCPHEHSSSVRCDSRTYALVRLAIAAAVSGVN
jgi:hypothetical protein